MSKKSLPQELVSAYFDDEVTPEERALIGQAVEQTPAIRQLLDDYSQLADCLRSMRQEVPSPRLTEAVMGEIRPHFVSSASTATTSAVRRWWMIAGGVMSTAAAGVLLMIWPAGPAENRTNDVAMMPAVEPAEATDGLLADNDAFPAPAIAARESGSVTDGVIPEASPAPAHDDTQPEDSPVRVASLPVESLLEKIAKERQVPKPGDVVKYLGQVADETVWIPLTVVDVQMVAGEICVLLTDHGIESPVGETIDATSNEPNIVILVESDWEKLEQVVADLDSHEYGQHEDVATSLEMQKVQIDQKLREPASGPQTTNEPVNAAAPDERSLVDRPSTESRPADDSPAPSRIHSRPLHAQIAARVSDKDVHEFELRGRSIFTEVTETSKPARQLAANEKQESTPAGLREPSEVDRFSRIHASPSTARVVFLIKKSK